VYVIAPWLVNSIAALLGAAGLATYFRERRASTRLWALLLGGLAGLAGTQLVMWPLAYCTFDVERNTLDAILGAALIATAGAALGALAASSLRRLDDGRGLIPAPETYAGVFKSPWAPLIALLCLLPTLTVLSVFHYYPLAQTFRLSTRLVRLGAPRTRFVCLNNFSSLFLDGDYWYSLMITFVIGLGVVLVAMSFGLLVAQMANLPIRGASVYRALLIWPIAISPIVAGVLFQLMLNPIAGVVNHLLEGAFRFRVPWLGNAFFATLSIILTAAWNQTGFNILFYIAGLKNVSPELLEAAYIDGANPIQGFFKITFPLLSPFTFFLIVTNTIYAFFQTFGVIDVLTRGGPVNATVSAMYRVYLVGIVGKDLGKAAAQSLLLLLIVVGITILQFRSSRERVSYST
jgi:sn-glycerol 3-phosphate transport system permease protein